MANAVVQFGRRYNKGDEDQCNQHRAEPLFEAGPGYRFGPCGVDNPGFPRSTIDRLHHLTS
jgi:hypothetical protein